MKLSYLPADSRSFCISRLTAMPCLLLFGCVSTSAQQIDPAQDWQSRSAQALHSEDFDYFSKNGTELGGSGRKGFQFTRYRTNGASNEMNRLHTIVKYADVLFSFSAVEFFRGYSLPNGPIPPRTSNRPEPPSRLSVDKGIYA